MKDITGLKFGRLLAIQRISNDKKGNARWLCKCDCGTNKESIGWQLRTNVVKSCGCLRQEGRSRPAIWLRKRPFEWVFNKLCKEAHKRHIQCDLTYEEYVSFTQYNTCHYCGNNIIWNQYANHKHNQGTNLDRVDASMGYSKDNCVVCCSICNKMKLDRTRDEFLQHCRTISLYNTSKN